MRELLVGLSVVAALLAFSGGVYLLRQGIRIEARTGSMIEAAPEIWAGCCLSMFSLLPAFVVAQLLMFE